MLLINTLVGWSYSILSEAIYFYNTLVMAVVSVALSWRLCNLRGLITGFTFYISQLHDSDKGLDKLYCFGTVILK
jgi:hypothetical protein